MANHLSTSQVNALPITPYSSIRSTIEDGYLIFASGNYLISKGIQSITNSPWSHVGILFNLKSLDRIMLLESVEDMGVRFAPISKYITNYENGLPYQGPIVIAKYLPGFGVSAVAEIAKFGIDQLTKPYDKEEIAEIAFRIKFGVGRKAGDNGKFICSELVADCFQKASVQFASQNGFITPEDIWTNSNIQLVARIQ